MLEQKTIDSACTKISDLLREEREKRNMRISALAERSGLSHNMIGYVERGLRKPTTETLVRMAYALEINLDELFKHVRFAPPLGEVEAKRK